MLLEEEPLCSGLVVLVSASRYWEVLAMLAKVRHPRLIAAAFIGILLIAWLQPAGSALGRSIQTDECVTFPETGREVCGKFLYWWREEGGLPRFGLPISDPIGGNAEGTYSTQYFERAIFETRPGTWVVDTAPLGRERFERKYPGAQGVREAEEGAIPGERMNSPDPYYPLSGVFLRFWLAHGGAEQMGYPISPLLIEKSELDGREYVMQYFPGAVLEYHSEYAPPNDVLLSQLGTFEYKKRFPRPEDILTGDWCGPEVRITDGTQLVFSGGESGEFFERPVLVFGHFEVSGTHMDTYRIRPYPGIQQEVHYVGEIVRDTMVLTMSYDDLGLGRAPHTYTLRWGECGAAGADPGR
jgi:hypothetical protein